MSDPTDTPPQAPQDPQPLVNFMSNEEWDQLLAEVDALVQDMDNLPYPNVKEKVFALLAGIDAIHREALGRLVRLFKDGVLEKVVTDPAIHTMMELYDLLPPEAKPADEQLTKIRITTSRSNAASVSSTESKVTSAARSPAKPKYPHWIPVLQQRDDLAEGTARECQVEDHSILLCRVADAFYAIGSQCVQDDASMAGANLTKYTLTCPHHTGCYYDVRTGGRIAGTLKLECYPVKQDDSGRVLVGIGMDFEPRLPAF